MDCLILGAGTNGILLSDILKVPCIGENLGGFVSSDFDAPKILHYSDDVRKYLESKNIKAQLEKYTCCYIYNNNIYNNIYSNDIDFRKLYAIKTERKINDSIMSASNNVILGYDAKNIINTIKDNVEYIQGKINKIEIKDDKINVYYNDCMKEYDKIINTLPITVLDKLMQKENDKVYLAKDIYYSLADIPDDVLKYNYAYVIDKDLPFYRITKNKTKHIIESYTPLDNKEFELCGCKFKCYNEKIAKNAKLINSYDNALTVRKHIINVGRYANWNHSLKMNDVIMQAYLLKQWLLM